MTEMERIYEILQAIRPEYDFHDSDDYISDGLLDSFDIIRLITELERVYQVEFDPMKLLPENFRNAESILKLFEEK